MPGPLAGIRVIDLTAIVSGPFCTALLADQGADVIKVEPLGIGDPIRYTGSSRGGVSGTFAVLNRGKRSLALNLREPRGVSILKDLVRGADVFAQNFRPGAAERMGIGYETLGALEPELIYVSISGFGRDGPYRSKRVYDPIIQGLSGMASVQARPGTSEPDMVRNIVCDKVTALTAAQAVTAALFARERGAGGQHLELSMLDAAVGFLWCDGMVNETLLGDGATRSPTLSEFYQVTQTADGFMTWSALSDVEFQGLCRAIERAEWAADSRFATLAVRIANVTELVPLLEAEFARHKTADLLSRLEAQDVPCAPINPVSSVADDPQVRHNKPLEVIEHPHAGLMRQPRPAARFEKTPASAGSPAPLLGEHSDQLLAELGLADGAIAELRESGVVG
jgi:crotonobetainyl-CoA:carnitine CoA-transferase CaiB-like acyl-CoA transferase